MYLSRLELFGFKSFAQKTHIDFHDGITAIVGPNGCGKSNVVDAIRWVLGEQKAGSLRSENMQNVIFNGTRTQKPLGMAEVSMTIQNNRNVLPIEYTEVVVTRRLFRSGESQYLLNNQTCRLKDIIDLFMDTGMGSNAYSVIELNMVEKILNGKPEERRMIFEEAAGVTKYKIRRRAAFRKLEATEQDLLRLTDILSEVEKTVNSLRRQVNKARRYQDYSAELRQLELDYSAFNLAKIHNELDPLTLRAKTLTDQKQKISTELATHEAEIEDLHLQMLEIERELNARGARLAANRQRIQQKEEEILVSQERIKAARSTRERAGVEIKELQRRAGDIESEQQEFQDSISRMQRDMTAREGDLQTAQRKLAAARELYTKKRDEAAAMESRRLQKLEETNEIQRREEKLKARLEVNEGRLQALTGEQETFSRQAAEAEERVQELTRQKQIVLEHVAQAAEQTAELAQDLEKTRGAIETTRQQILELNGQARNKKERAEMLQRVLDTYEDYPAGVRYLLLDSVLPDGVHGTLGDLISVDSKFQKAIEAALGEAAVALIVDGSARAIEAIDLLKSAGKGTVTFLPLDAVAAADQDPELPQENGILGKASALIKTREAFRGIISELLADVLVVDRLETATRLAKQARGRRLSFVTLGGEIVTSWGMVRGGKAEETDTGLVGRRALVERLNTEIAALTGQVQEATAALEKLERQHTALSARRDELEQQKKKHEQNLQQIEIAIGNARGEIQRAAEQGQYIQTEEQRLSAQIAEARQSLGSLQPSLEALQGEKAAIEEDYQVLLAETGKLEADVQAAEAEAQRINLAFVKQQSELNNLQENLSRLLRSATETTAAIQRHEEEIVSAKNQIDELEERIRALREHLQDDFAEKKELEEVIEEINRRYREFKETSEAKEKAVRKIRSQRDELADELHRIELKISELRMNAENIAEQMRENYELDIRTQPAPAELDTTAAAKRINELKQKIRAIGPVNMLALKDYETEKERLDFLQTQKSDLLEAEENLKETIRVINSNAYERFNAVFSQVRENFIQVFKSFFEDGNADLRLDGDDPLEAEIVIEASPKGKKLGSLSLLSGGEKTLTAISLLFAIYLVKPSPFCIFDEVDAPLDDTNISQFTGALRKFSDNTQFIVVTHNKLTMNSANQLYGITMEEPGISKVVSVKFEEAANGSPGNTAAATSEA